jgi:hypothetical protein
VVYNLGGAYTSFLSDVGIDDETGDGTCGTVVFEVYLDNVLAYTSGTMTPTTATKSINISVAGKNQMKLLVTLAGDNNFCDHADWAGARLTSGSARIAAEKASPTEAVTVYPNPARDILHVKVYAEVAQPARLSLTGARGKNVLSEVRNLQAGENTLSVAVDRLPAGLYLLEVGSGTGRLTKKVVIAR